MGRNQDSLAVDFLTASDFPKSGIPTSQFWISRHTTLNNEPQISEEPVSTIDNYRESWFLPMKNFLMENIQVHCKQSKNFIWKSRPKDFGILGQKIPI
jgi:hypothetical protein